VNLALVGMIVVVCGMSEMALGGGLLGQAGGAIYGGVKHTSGVISNSTKHTGKVISSDTKHAGGVISGSVKHSGSVISSGAKHSGGVIASSTKHVGGAVSSGTKHAGGAISSGSKSVGGAAAPVARGIAGGLLKGALSGRGPGRGPGRDVRVLGDKPQESPGASQDGRGQNQDDTDQPEIPSIATGVTQPLRPGAEVYPNGGYEDTQAEVPKVVAGELQLQSSHSTRQRVSASRSR
jgi:hypothetical protein